MKAWMCWVDDSDKGCGIVFAESRNKARMKALNTNACEDERYIDVRVKRLKKLDGMEGVNPFDNPWLDDGVRLILVRDYGWYCIDPLDKECDECSAKEYCERNYRYKDYEM